MSDDLSDLLPLFLREAGERLERLAQISSGTKLGEDSLRSARRELHALKGASRMMRLLEMSELCHAGEEVLQPLADDSQSRLLEIVDRLSAMVSQLAGGDSFGGDAGRETRGDQPDQSPSEGSELPVSPRFDSGAELRVGASVMASMADRSARARVLSVASRSLVERVFELAQLAEWGVNERQPEQVLATLATTLRQLALDFEGNQRRIQRLTEAQLDELIHLQVQPLKPYLLELGRHARELARSLGKKVNVQVNAGESSLDRRIIDALKEAFLHLVRNAVDHGLESAAERAEAGKPAEGSLRLSAETEADRVRIEVVDDGRGLDPDTVAAAAVARGLIGNDDAARMSREQKLQLACLPGVSTRAEATGISGRGVGMDAVAAAVREVGGELWISSRPGEGATMRMTVPVARRGERVLVMSMGQQLLAVPTSVVRAFRRLTSEMRLGDGDLDHLQIDGRLVPVRVLSESFEASAETGHVLVELCVGTIDVALVVDGVVGEEEVFLRPLSPFLGAAAIFDSMAVISSGRPIPVLSPALLTTGQAPAMTVAERSGMTSVLRVLLVDDSQVTREMIRRVLEDGGFAVGVAGGADEALRILSERDFDCVITDIEMPGMDGLELTRHLRELQQFAHLPVVVVSTRDRAEDRLAGLEAGADAYLTKQGLNARELVSLVRRVGGRP